MTVLGQHAFGSKPVACVCRDGIDPAQGNDKPCQLRCTRVLSQLSFTGAKSDWHYQ